MKISNQLLIAMARFWKNVDVISHNNSDKCWLWKGGQNGRGYGIAAVGNGKTMLAHRAVVYFRDGHVPPHCVVMHRCDNPLCVKPDHLILATQKDNMIDMMKKNRRSRKVTVEIVKDIRTNRLSISEFAKLYNISTCTVREIQKRITWNWLD